MKLIVLESRVINPTWVQIFTPQFLTSYLGTKLVFYLDMYTVSLNFNPTYVLKNVYESHLGT
jgi:hypothetical protein